MAEYRFKLEDYTGPGSRYECPKCGRKGKFTRYIDKVTKAHIGPGVGICDRKNNCRYHLTPRDYFFQNNISFDPFLKKEEIKVEFVKPASFIPKRIMEGSFRQYYNNNLALFLDKYFDPAIRRELTEKYFIGTSRHLTGATVFWQVDTNGRVRSGKIIVYNSETGKRLKDPIRATWAHKVLKIKGFQLVQCLFGEHLLKQDPNKPIVIVESEKSAIIASVYFPQYIWLACGGSTQLNLNKLIPLKGRKIILLPDTDALNTWKDYSDKLSKELNQEIRVSAVLENIVTELERFEGWDIADYLMASRYNEIININD